MNYIKWLNTITSYCDAPLQISIIQYPIYSIAVTVVVLYSHQLLRNYAVRMHNIVNLERSPLRINQVEWPLIESVSRCRSDPP